MKSNEFEWKFKRERFYFFAGGWNIDQAKQFIMDRPRKVRMVNIEHLKEWVARTETIDPDTGAIVQRDQMIPGKSYQVHGGVIVIDYKRIDAMIADEPVEHPLNLDFPIILSWVKNQLFPIDGWQRIAYALAKGETVLPCVILNKQESRKVILK